MAVFFITSTQSESQASTSVPCNLVTFRLITKPWLHHLPLVICLHWKCYNSGVANFTNKWLAVFFQVSVIATISGFTDSTDIVSSFRFVYTCGAGREKSSVTQRLARKLKCNFLNSTDHFKLSSYLFPATCPTFPDPRGLTNLPWPDPRGMTDLPRPDPRGLTDLSWPNPSIIY